MSLSTGKIAEVMFDKWKETYEHQDDMLILTDFHEPDLLKTDADAAFYLRARMC